MWVSESRSTRANMPAPGWSSGRAPPLRHVLHGWKRLETAEQGGKGGIGGGRRRSCRGITAAVAAAAAAAAAVAVAVEGRTGTGAATKRVSRKPNELLPVPLPLPLLSRRMRRASMEGSVGAAGLSAHLC